MIQIFPVVESVFNGQFYSEDFNDRCLKEMRVCHPSNFDKYFQFSIPSGELSNSDLQNMLKLTSDSDSFSSLILSFKELGILQNALSQFGAFTNEIPLQNQFDYIKGILDIGDQVDHESTGFTESSSNVHAARLVFMFLRRIENLNDRGKLLLECFQASRGMSIVQRILQDEENRRKGSDSNLSLIHI